MPAEELGRGSAQRSGHPAPVGTAATKRGLRAESPHLLFKQQRPNWNPHVGVLSLPVRICFPPLHVAVSSRQPLRTRITKARPAQPQRPPTPDAVRVPTSGSFVPAPPAVWELLLGPHVQPPRHYLINKPETNYCCRYAATVICHC